METFRRPPRPRRQTGTFNGGGRLPGLPVRPVGVLNGNGLLPAWARPVVIGTINGAARLS